MKKKMLLSRWASSRNTITLIVDKVLLQATIIYVRSVLQHNLPEQLPWVRPTVAFEWWSVTVE